MIAAVLQMFSVSPQRTPTNSLPYLSDHLTVYTAARQLRPSSDSSVVHLSVQYPMV